MAQHPEMYSSDELAKFAANTSSRPTEIHGSHVDSPAPPYATSPALTNTSFNSPHASPEPLQQECHELEARDRDRNLDEKVAREREYQRQVAAAASAGGGVAVPPAPAGGALPTRERPTTTLRQRMADFEEEEEEEDGDEVGGGAWAYSGEAVRVAPAARVVQLPPPYPSRDKGLGFEPTPLETAIETALPDQNTVSQLDRWLQAQRSTGTLQRKGGRLRVVNEEAGEEG
ncbi:hypothetical protein B0A54_14204 [Friedmanniomyces endolithicus]|uniref:Uncharacterized protein n=1 Tax=Friedmanniomyces endolithicus TaxID=329885 RepID=A0A4U0UFZ9_9PEZI|nr:hypothetical protein B0A54_14204 [Friedmanniomyces endolithicus]